MTLDLSYDDTEGNTDRVIRIPRQAAVIREPEQHHGTEHSRFMSFFAVTNDRTTHQV